MSEQKTETAKSESNKEDLRRNKTRMTRREALGVGAASLAGAAIASVMPGTVDKAQAQKMDHSGHDMKAMKMDHSGHDMSKMNMARPKVTGKVGEYSIPTGNKFYARTVDQWEGWEPGMPGRDYTPVVIPNGSALPFKIVDGVKVFHMDVRETVHEFAPGLKAVCWGYNGQMPGPVVEAVEGDRIRIYVTNRLSTKTSVHWHAIILPHGMDGVAGLSHRKISPGETFKYEWTLNQHGTFMYHSHTDTMTQEGMGLTGMFIVHPRRPKEPRPDRDFVLLMNEFDIKPGTYRPDPNVFSGYNTLTLNGKVFPGTAPLVSKQGDKVRIRIGNLSAMDHHPLHLHGHAFEIVETDGGVIPVERRWPETTVLVSVGQTRAVELVADNPGDWAMHCHMTHHTMNQMGHEIPNTLGIKHQQLDWKMNDILPGYMTMGANGMGEMAQHAAMMEIPENSIPMMGTPGAHDYISLGGMVTVFKVREELSSYDDPGWYNAPKGTTATTASSADLRRDGIKV